MSVESATWGTERGDTFNPTRDQSTPSRGSSSSSSSNTRNVTVSSSGTESWPTVPRGKLVLSSKRRPSLDWPKFCRFQSNLKDLRSYCMRKCIRTGTADKNLNRSIDHNAKEMQRSGCLGSSNLNPSSLLQNLNLFNISEKKSLGS